MSIVHSSGVMSTDSTTAVERHIVAVDRVYDDERGHQAIGVKGRVISISGGGSGNQKRRVDYNNRAEEHHNMVSVSCCEGCTGCGGNRITVIKNRPSSVVAQGGIETTDAGRLLIKSTHDEVLYAQGWVGCT